MQESLFPWGPPGTTSNTLNMVSTHMPLFTRVIVRPVVSEIGGEGDYCKQTALSAVWEDSLKIQKQLNFLRSSGRQDVSEMQSSLEVLRKGNLCLLYCQFPDMSKHGPGRTSWVQGSDAHKSDFMLPFSCPGTHRRPCHHPARHVLSLSLVWGEWSDFSCEWGHPMHCMYV